MPEFQLRTGRERTLEVTATFRVQAAADTGGTRPKWQVIEALTGFTFYVGLSGYFQLWAGGRTTDPCNPDTGFPEPHGWTLTGPPWDEVGFVIQLVLPDGTFHEPHEFYPGVSCAAFRKWPLNPDSQLECTGRLRFTLETEEWLVLDIDRRMPRESFPIASNQSGLPNDIDGVGYVKGSYFLGPKAGGTFTFEIQVDGGSSTSGSGIYSGPTGPDAEITRLACYIAGGSQRSDSQWGNPPWKQAELSVKLWDRGYDFSCLGVGNSFRPSGTTVIAFDGTENGTLAWSVGPLPVNLWTVGFKAPCFCDPPTPLELDFWVVPFFQDAYVGSPVVRQIGASTFTCPNGKLKQTITRRHTLVNPGSPDWVWQVCHNGSLVYVGVNGIQVEAKSMRFALANSWLNSDREAGLREDNRDWRLLVDDVFTAFPVKLSLPSSYILDPMNSTSGWFAFGCTISIEDGALKVVPSIDGAFITRDFGSNRSISAYRFITVEAKGTGGSFVFSVNGRYFKSRKATSAFVREEFDICAPNSTALSDATDHGFKDDAVFQGPVYVRAVTISDLRAGQIYWFKNLGFRVRERWGLTPIPTFREYFDWTDFSDVKWRWWRGAFGETDGRRTLEIPFRRRRLQPAGTDSFLTLAEALSMLPPTAQVVPNTPPDASDRTRFLFGEFGSLEAWFVAETLYLPTSDRRFLFRERAFLETTGLPVRLRFDEFFAYSGFGKGSANSTWDAIPVRITKHLRMPLEGLVVDPEKNSWRPGARVDVLRDSALVESLVADEVGYFRSSPLLFKKSNQTSVGLALRNDRSGTVSLSDATPSGNYNDPAIESVGGWYAHRKARRCILTDEAAAPPEVVAGCIEAWTPAGLYLLGGEDLQGRDVAYDRLFSFAPLPFGRLHRLRFFNERLFALAFESESWKLLSTEDFGTSWETDMSFTAKSALVECITEVGEILLFYENDGPIQVRRSIDGGVSFSDPQAVYLGSSPLAGKLLDCDYHSQTNQLFLLIQQANNARLLISEDFGSTFMEVL